MYFQITLIISALLQITSPEIVQDPVDTVTTLNSVAVLNCTAPDAIVIFWNVTTTAGMERIFQTDEHAEEGFEAFISDSDPKTSTLRISATAEVDKAAITCFATYPTLTVVSNVAFLTVKGIGPVEHLTPFLQPPSIVLTWNPPEFRSQDIDTVLYKVCAVGEDMVVVLQQNTSLNSYSTSYSFITPCHHYTFIVQATSDEYVSEESTIELYLYAENAKIQTVECHVQITDTESVKAFCNIQMVKQCFPISLELSFVPVGNTTANPVVFTPALKVSEPDIVLHPAKLRADEKYNVTAKLYNNSQLIASSLINISTFDVQGISRPIEVRLNTVCPNISFASGSMADAFVSLRRIDTAGLGAAFNRTIQQNRSTQQAYGCVEVSSNGGIYKLSIYDIQNESRSKKPALILPELIEVAPLPTSKDPISSPTSTPVNNSTILVPIISPTVVIIVVFVKLIIVVGCIIWFKHRRKKNRVEKFKHEKYQETKEHEEKSKRNHSPHLTKIVSRTSSQGSNGKHELEDHRSSSMQDVLPHPHTPTHNQQAEYPF